MVPENGVPGVSTDLSVSCVVAALNPHTKTRVRTAAHAYHECPSCIRCFSSTLFLHFRAERLMSLDVCRSANLTQPLSLVTRAALLIARIDDVSTLLVRHSALTHTLAGTSRRHSSARRSSSTRAFSVAAARSPSPPPTCAAPTASSSPRAATRNLSAAPESPRRCVRVHAKCRWHACAPFSREHHTVCFGGAWDSAHRRAQKHVLPNYACTHTQTHSNTHRSRMRAHMTQALPAPGACRKL